MLGESADFINRNSATVTSDLRHSGVRSEAALLGANIVGIKDPSSGLQVGFGATLWRRVRGESLGDAFRDDFVMSTLRKINAR